MKGISTILATILIVIIVVALVSLTYTFAVGLFTTASTGAEKGVQATTIRLDKSVSIVGTPTCTLSSSTYTVSFTIRHIGSTYNMTESEVSAFLGGGSGTFSSFGTQLAPGGTKTLSWTNSSAVIWSTTGTTFTVSAPAADASKTLTTC
jgi:FlaG/FlaF family flagellin (archaellin)